MSPKPVQDDQAHPAGLSAYIVMPSCDHKSVIEVTGMCDKGEEAHRDIDGYIALCAGAAPDSVALPLVVHSLHMCLKTAS